MGRRAAAAGRSHGRRAEPPGVVATPGSGLLLGGLTRQWQVWLHSDSGTGQHVPAGAHFYGISWQMRPLLMVRDERRVPAVGHPPKPVEIDVTKLIRNNSEG